MRTITYARRINQHGNLGFTIPVDVARKLNLNEDMVFKIKTEGNSIIFTQVAI